VRERAVPVVRVVRAGAVRAALATTRRCGCEVAGTRRRITWRFRRGRSHHESLP